MTVLRLDDLHPDGVPLFVDWEHFLPGRSVFAPCVNTTAAIKQMKGVAGRHGWTVVTQIRVERHILGVRMWRTA